MNSFLLALGRGYRFKVRGENILKGPEGQLSSQRVDAEEGTVVMFKITCAQVHR